jgi:hypothetical protein
MPYTSLEFDLCEIAAIHAALLEFVSSPTRDLESSTLSHAEALLVHRIGPTLRNLEAQLTEAL